MRGLVCVIVCAACGGSSTNNGDDDPGPLPAPSCASDGGGTTVSPPALRYTLADRWHEAWLASPAVADLNADGTMEIVAPRHDQLIVWHVDGSIAWRATLPGRIWSSPVVADLDSSRAGLETAVAARGVIAAFDAAGQPLPGFPFMWRDEMRSLAAGDIDGNGDLELVAVTTSPLNANNQRDIVIAVHHDGSIVSGFPPNTSGAAGCDDACYVTGGYDQNIALGDVNGDDKADIFAPQDNAYMSLHDGTGRAFDAATIFRDRTKFSGIRWMVDYALAQQGYANNEDVEDQAHFTNTAPSIADLDGDGTAELVALGSIQNAAQTDRERGVGLFVMRHDGTRPDAWLAPPRFADYTSGLWDGGNNIVGITNQVAIAELDPSHAGPELVFAGYDQRIHGVSAAGVPLWSSTYTTRTDTWTAGVAIADLSADGVPELVLTTYGPSGGDLIVLDGGGNELHRIPLGGRGAMPVPTIADTDGNGTLDIVVSLKDGEDRTRQVVIYEVAGSSTKCLLWPTGRGNYHRNSYVPPK
jgi:hypothetical protein